MLATCFIQAITLGFILPLLYSELTYTFDFVWFKTHLFDKFFCPMTFVVIRFAFILSGFSVLSGF